MINITVAVPEEHLEKLQEVAARFSTTPEVLVRASIEELLSHPDESFQRTVDYVMQKNADLYRRLA